MFLPVLTFEKRRKVPAYKKDKRLTVFEELFQKESATETILGSFLPKGEK